MKLKHCNWPTPEKLWFNLNVNLSILGNSDDLTRSSFILFKVQYEPLYEWSFKCTRYKNRQYLMHYSSKKPPAHNSVTITGSSTNLHAISHFSQHQLWQLTMLFQTNVTPEILPSRTSAAFLKGFFAITSSYDKIVFCIYWDCFDRNLINYYFIAQYSPNMLKCTSHVPSLYFYFSGHSSVMLYPTALERSLIWGIRIFKSTLLKTTVILRSFLSSKSAV